MPLAIPESIKLEHEELHDALARASREKDPLGEAAKRVARILKPHVAKEELFAFPPLGLLEEVARGERPAAGPAALGMTERLRAELDDMLAEHRVIIGALEDFMAAARAVDRVDYAELASKLVHHMRTEKEVLYPAALLLGDHLRSRLADA